MARAHVWWSVALLVVPAVLAGLALLWAAPRERVAPPVPTPRVLPATPAVPAERITARGPGATKPLATVEAGRRVEITIG